MVDLPQAQVYSRPRFVSGPLFILAAAMSLGILVGHYWRSQSKLIFVVSIGLSVGLGLFSLSLIITNHVSTSETHQTAASAFMIAAFLCAGFVLSLVSDRAPAPNRIARMYVEGVLAPGDPVEITGVIKGEPELAPQSFYLTLQAERIRVKESEREASGIVMLLARVSEQAKPQYDAMELRHGARVRVMTTLDREDDFRNPGVLLFTEYLERKGFDATGVIKSPLLIERLDDETVFLPPAWLYQWRARLQREFSDKFSAETAGVLGAALLGNPHNISRSTAERFRAGGTFHILVISGLQIAFIAGVAFLIARRVTNRKILQFALAGSFLWAYAIAVGAEASVTRAALMFTLAAFAPVVARKASALNTIGGAALALLILHPSDLFDPSFQLTFLSVLAIVCVAVPVWQNMQRVGSWRPTMVTPYPPQCAPWFRTISEALFWSERDWKREMDASNIRYRLFKTSFAAKLERWHVQKLLRFAVSAVIVSASVQAVLLPLMVLYFHRISIASLVLNIFVGALMVVLAFAALGAVIVSHLSLWLAGPLVVLAEKTNWLMIHLVDPFSSFGLASIRVPHYTGWPASIYALYFIALGCLIFALARWNPLRAPSMAITSSRLFSKRVVTAALATLVSTLVVIIFHPFSSAGPDGKLHVEFLDVGQGDCALLTMPDGTTVLVDGGGRPAIGSNDSEGERDDAFERDSRSIGERVVSEYLWSRGLDRVDYIVATHADADHIDGLSDVVRNFSVRGAIVARTPSVDAEFARFAETMRQAQVPLHVVGAGDAMNIGSVTFEVLWPPPNPAGSSGNNDSALLRVRMGDRAILLTGDIEKEGEARVLTEGIDLRSDIVKVAHHGSRTSSIPAFVNATRASLAVISVGRSSMFGHPHQEVVERWRASGAQVMTTGEKGTISVVTDGRGLSVSTFVRE